MAELIHVVGRALGLVEPVLIAPQGDAWHRAKAVQDTAGGRIGHVLEPVCGGPPHPWVAVTVELAELLQRSPCQRCHPIDGAQLAVSDIDPEEAT